MKFRRRREGEENWSMDTKRFFFDGDNSPPTALLFGPKFMESKMHQLSPPEVNTISIEFWLFEKYYHPLYFTKHS